MYEKTDISFCIILLRVRKNEMLGLPKIKFRQHEEVVNVWYDPEKIKYPRNSETGVPSQDDLLKIMDEVPEYRYIAIVDYSRFWDLTPQHLGIKYF